MFSIILLTVCRGTAQALDKYEVASNTPPNSDWKNQAQRIQSKTEIKGKMGDLKKESIIHDSTLAFIEKHMIHPDTSYALADLAGRVYASNQPPNGIRFHGSGGRSKYGLQYDSKQEVYRIRDSTYLNLFLSKAIKEADYPLPVKGQKIGHWVDTVEIGAMEWFILINVFEIRFGILIEQDINSNMRLTFEEFATLLTTLPQDNSGPDLFDKLIILCQQYHEYLLKHGNADDKTTPYLD